MDEQHKSKSPCSNRLIEYVNLLCTKINFFLICQIVTEDLQQIVIDVYGMESWMFAIWISDGFFGELPPRPRCAHQSAWQINEPEEVGSQWNLTELYVWHSRSRSDEILSVNRHLESHLSGKKSQHEWIHMQVHRFDISALTLGRKRQMGLEFYIILLLSYRLLNLHL